MWPAALDVIAVCLLACRRNASHVATAAVCCATSQPHTPQATDCVVGVVVQRQQRLHHDSILACVFPPPTPLCTGVLYRAHAHT